MNTVRNVCYCMFVFVVFRRFCRTKYGYSRSVTVIKTFFHVLSFGYFKRGVIRNHYQYGEKLRKKNPPHQLLICLYRYFFPSQFSWIDSDCFIWEHCNECKVNEGKYKVKVRVLHIQSEGTNTELSTFVAISMRSIFMPLSAFDQNRL